MLQDPEPSDTINGKPVYNMKTAANYLGISPAALQNILRRNPQIKKYSRGYGKERYLLKEDLDALKEPRIVED